jgi:hypothetical protein
MDIGGDEGEDNFLENTQANRRIRCKCEYSTIICEKENH